MKATLVNGFNWPYLSALETEEYYNGSNRRTMTLTIDPATTGVDALAAQLTEANLSTLVLTSDDGTISNSYTGYVLPLSCGLQSVLKQAETPETPAVYEQKLIVKLGRRTYIEEQLHKLGIS